MTGIVDVNVDTPHARHFSERLNVTPLEGHPQVIPSASRGRRITIKLNFREKRMNPSIAPAPDSIAYKKDQSDQVNIPEKAYAEMTEGMILPKLVNTILLESRQV